jgi:hypothetical protein
MGREDVGDGEFSVNESALVIFVRCVEGVCVMICDGEKEVMSGEERCFIAPYHYKSLMSNHNSG